MLETLGLLVCAAGLWLWHDSLKAREAGMRACRAACSAESILFLDDTVSIASMWPARDDLGRLKFRRVYEFEYSDTGDNRRKGSVTLIGDSVVTIYLAPRLVQQSGFH